MLYNCDQKQQITTFTHEAKKMKTWKAQDTEKADYVGIVEFQSNDGEWHNFEVVKTPTHLIFGGCTNIGLLESGNMEIDDCFSIDENLQELIADLETYYNGGPDYVAYIICNERM